MDQVYSNARVPTKVNKSPYESTRVRHESTRINTIQHKSIRVRHESTRYNRRPTLVKTRQLD